MARPFSAWPDQVSICEINDADECGVIVPQSDRPKWLVWFGLACLVVSILFLMGLIRPSLPY
jgi:hypothetical protein